MKKENKEMRQLRLAIDAFSHPIRKSIINLLSRYPLGISPIEIIELLGEDVTLAKINRSSAIVGEHLIILLSCRLVYYEVRKPFHIYKANIETVAFLKFAVKEWAKLTKKPPSI